MQGLNGSQYDIYISKKKKGVYFIQAFLQLLFHAPVPACVLRCSIDFGSNKNKVLVYV